MEVSGTKHAMSPEIFRHMVNASAPQGYSYEIDWWAVGIMTYELLKGTPPFGLVGDDIFDNILRGIDSVDFSEIPQEGEEFIKLLLREDPAYRLGHNGVDEVIAHPFIRGHSSQIVPNFNQMTLIESWCEFIEDEEEYSVKGQDPFSDF